jgi:hypothetical protein
MPLCRSRLARSTAGYRRVPHLREELALAHANATHSLGALGGVNKAGAMQTNAVARLRSMKDFGRSTNCGALSSSVRPLRCALSGAERAGSLFAPGKGSAGWAR